MEPELWVVFTAVSLPFAAAAVTPLLCRLLGEKVGYFGAVIAAVSFGLVGSQVGAEGTVSIPWVPSLDIAATFYIDGWAVMFALLASGIGVVIFGYSATYMHKKPSLGRFYGTLLAFMGSILGVAFAGDLILLFLFWELTSVCSFVLIGYHTEEDESRYSARMAMVVTVGGGLCLLFALLMVVLATGSVSNTTEVFDIATVLSEGESVKAALEETGLFLPALGLLGVAAGAKSAQVPLHFWLPRAMVAPTPVSAFLHSATMVKVGVYAIGRLRPVFYGLEWSLVFATVGLATMTVGAFLAVVSTDIKELLAYSTASHLGLMVAGFGFLTHYGAEAGVFHMLNHALFKAPLFLVAGIVAHEAGTRYIGSLGGLRGDLPLTAGVALITALSMAGVPPLSGFYSKEILFEATVTVAEEVGGLAWLYPTTAVFGSVFTVVYSLRFLGIFFGKRDDSLGSVGRPSPGLILPAGVLAGATAFVSVAPGTVIEAVVQDAAGATAAGGETVDVHAPLPTKISPPVVMTVTALGAGSLGYVFYEKVDHFLGGGRDAVRPLHPSLLYDKAMDGAEVLSTRMDGFVHNGLIRTYVGWTLGAGCFLVLLGYAVTPTTVSVSAPTGIESPPAMVLVLGVAVVATVAVATSSSHVTGVLTLGIVGFMVAIFYILASAPDLALTQLVVETLVLLVFLLVIEELPAFYTDLEPKVVLRDGVFALGVGTTAFVSVLVASPSQDRGLTETAGSYVESAVPEGGGTNVVNVILTDFRAFDTLGEATVVVIATLSVLVLLMMRGRGEKR